MKKSKSTRFLLGFIAIFLFCYPVSADEEFLIGVLAKRGPQTCLKKWSETAAYLTQTIPGKSFEIVPLSFNAVNTSVENGEVDFLLVNSSMFMTTKLQYKTKAIATLVNSRQGKALKSFGGVIFTSKRNASRIKGLHDLKGKSFMGVKKSSFGGWQMAYKIFKDVGIDPYKDFSAVSWGASHDKVIFAVNNGEVDAGTVRSDTLERMVEEKKISLDDFIIINEKKEDDFPFIHSTPLYPEWPLAKLSHISDKAAKEVKDALLKMAASTPAAKDAKIVGWTAPLDYSQIEKLQKTLKIGSFE